MEASSSSHNTPASRSFCGTGGPSKFVDMLIRHIQEVLSAITDKGLRSDMLPSRVKLMDIVQPVTSDFSKIFEGISEGAKTIGDQMSASSKLSVEAIKMASDVMQALGNFHFASAALLAIATVLERVEKISANDRDCLDLIKAMLDLAKFIKCLTDMNLHTTQIALYEKMTEAVHVIYVGAIMCRSFLISKNIWKFLLTTKVRDELVRLWKKVDSIKLDLILLMQMTVVYSLTSINTFRQPPFSVHEGLPTGDFSRVEITEAIEEDHGMEQGRQLELGPPVQNLLLHESSGMVDDIEVVTNSKRRRRYEVFHRMSKLLKKVTPKLDAIPFGRNKQNTGEWFPQEQRRFSYAELAAATRNFSEDHKLGQGGFGSVYRGVLAGTNETLAVKKMSKDSIQGKRQYVSEVTITRELSHRNVIKLKGWCHKKGELLLVYEFFTNGSLDKYLFAEHNGTTHLGWERRYSIACDVASALLYLHEDERVVHRDIKPSNVMLDSNFTAKLADFGLAIVLEHDEEASEMTIAGTFGYLDPEYCRTARVSLESDLFSFGAMALTITCGKQPWDRTMNEHSYSLVEWVWDLYRKGKILEAADEKLEGDFKAEEMERLMAVGLLCSHGDPKARPTARQVLKILKFETELPCVHLNSSYNGALSPSGSNGASLSFSDSELLNR